jgi:hypothetical protein
VCRRIRRQGGKAACCFRPVTDSWHCVSWRFDVVVVELGILKGDGALEWRGLDVSVSSHKSLRGRKHKYSRVAPQVRTTTTTTTTQTRTQCSAKPSSSATSRPPLRSQRAAPIQAQVATKAQATDAATTIKAKAHSCTTAATATNGCSSLSRKRRRASLAGKTPHR